MKKEDLMAILEAAPKIGQVEAKDFAGFVAVLERKNRRTGEVKENPYMAVDGRIAMARLDHTKQQGTLDIGPLEILEQNDNALTVQIKIVSSLYGTVYGTASSRLNTGGAEGEHPWEVAETSATGRALGMLGYGLLPGAGLASAEDMERATEEGSPATSEGRAEGTGPGAFVFPWGKYRAKKTVAQVAKEDPTYLDYVLDESTDAEARKAVREYLEEQARKEIPKESAGPDTEEMDQAPTPEGQEPVDRAADEALGGKKSLAGSTAFWAKARSLKMSTPEGKKFLKVYTGEDGRIDWEKATEALGKEE